MLQASSKASRVGSWHVSKESELQSVLVHSEPLQNDYQIAKDYFVDDGVVALEGGKTKPHPKFRKYK